MAFHFIVRFEPLPGKADEFRKAMLEVLPYSRSEPGCLSIRAFESIREPYEFAIYSGWVDEAAFERHVELPHTVRFIEVAEPLLTHPIKGLRSRLISLG